MCFKCKISWNGFTAAITPSTLYVCALILCTFLLITFSSLWILFMVLRKCLFIEQRARGGNENKIRHIHLWAHQELFEGHRVRKTRTFPKAAQSLAARRPIPVSKAVKTFILNVGILCRNVGQNIIAFAGGIVGSFMKYVSNANCRELRQSRLA